MLSSFVAKPLVPDGEYSQKARQPHMTAMLDNSDTSKLLMDCAQSADT